MFAGMLVFATGIFCLLQFNSLPSFWLICLLPLSFILSRYYFCARFIVLFFLGFSWALIRLGYDLNPEIDSSVLSKDSLITGTVISLPKIYPDHVRFLFKTSEIKTDENHHHKTSITIRLSWYRTQDIPAPGEIWQFRARLKYPYGFMNPGGFDYEKWLLRQGIRVVAYVKNDTNNGRIKTTSTHLVQQLRYSISERLDEIVKQPLRGFALALSLGERSQLSQAQNHIMQKTGTSHLVAISGLHLALVAGVMFFLSRFIVSRFYFITQRIPAAMCAAVVSFIVVFFYAALAGFTLPTQRALIMIGMFLLAFLSRRQFKIINIISLAAILILILDPMAIIAVDFWLSFMAVFFIIYITRFRICKLNKSVQWLRLQLLLSIALYPLLAFWFMQIPIYSALANLIAIPVVGFIIVPVLFLALLFLFPWPDVSLLLYGLLSRVNDYYWSFLAFIAEKNNSVIPVAMPGAITLVLAIIGVLILLMPKGLPARSLGVLFLLPLFFPVIDKPEQNEFDFTLLDVGQGLSAVIKTNKHILIYDTGARFSERFNTGDAVLLPYLKYNGIKAISMLMLSHGDNDHIGGVEALINNFDIDAIVSSAPLVFDNIATRHCSAGEKWIWDGVSFEILHPTLETGLTGNNTSCVLKISAQGGSILLTGDIEKEAEHRLSKLNASKLNADILVVPHHGSRTSSTLEFIRQVDPKYAFFPAGYRNRFGFPKQDIMSRYKSLGIETRISYQTGAISVRFGEKNLRIDEFRKQNKRIWHY